MYLIHIYKKGLAYMNYKSWYTKKPHHKKSTEIIIHILFNQTK